MGTKSYQFKVGAFDCLCVSDGSYDYPPETFVANIPTERFQQELAEHALPTDHITSPYSSLLIDTGAHKVLIDTGAGFAPSNGHLLRNLQAEGIAPEAIDTVVLTHAHADHIGANIGPDGKASFPNARYVIAKSEWDFWTQEPNLSPMPVDDHLKHLLIAAAEQGLTPLQNHIDQIENEVEIVPGIYAVPAPGHTPGHMALLISSGKEHLFHLADTVLHPILMEHPDWYPRVDLIPDQALITKRRLLDRAAVDRVPVFLYHVAPFPSLGQVIPHGNAWTWQPIAPAGARAEDASATV
jgi:glyoxylase-like metal-dependent hydrolase (beta-lactamase superfamily II)